MKKKRVIPVMLMKNGFIVQSRNFKRHQNLGSPITAVKRLSEWSSDELIFLDITKDNQYDLKRDDINFKNLNSFLKIIEEISKKTFMPIIVGGKIKSLIDIEERLKVCADKVSINSWAFKNKNFINNAAKEFGSQCIVSSIDVKKIGKEHLVFIDSGLTNTNLKVENWVKEIQDMGAGEIFLNSIDNDGLGGGYDEVLIEKIHKIIKVPLIICGGVGSYQDLEIGLKHKSVDGVAAANFFHHTDQSVYLSKKYLYEQKMNIRKPQIFELE
jgi:imidazole glycerol-phosphate synthase subunit HisF